MNQGTDMLPTFFVIGAPKCGTTSLHHYLDQHPEISMTSVKEPFVFAAADWRDRLGGYASLFEADVSVRGESSTVYSQHPQYPGVPERIADVVPDARIIYIVGEPVTRALAHYRQHVADGKEDRPPDEAFADYDAEDSVYLCASRYRTQLRRYLTHFPADRILVLEQAELLEARERAMARAFDFLGVDPEVRSDAFDTRLNRAEDLRLATAVGRRVGGSRLASTARRMPLPAVVRRSLGRALSRPLPELELGPALRATIADTLREEVAWLREFSGRPFDGWPR